MKKHAASSAGHKQLAGTSSIRTAGQGGLFEYAWPIVAAGFGTLLVLSFLLPVDSISVFIGSAQPQNLGWLALAAIAAWLSRNSSIQVRASQLELLLAVGGLIWLLIVTWIASSRGDGRAVWNGFWQVVSLAGCFYIARAIVQSPKVQRVLVLAIVVGCSSLSLQGLEQVLISMPANRAEYAKDPDRMLHEQGIDAPPGSPRRKQFEDRLNSPEPFATFALANSLATLLSLGVVLNGGLLLESVTRRNKAEAKDSFHWFRITAIAAMLAIQFVCLLLTRSRTAYLSLILAAAVWMLLESSRGKVVLSTKAIRWSGVALAIGLVASLAWLVSVDRLVWSEAPKSISYRLEYWQATLAMIRDHFWTGVGLGNFQAYYPQYKLEVASETIADPHNWILDIAATLSAPSLLLIVGWLGVLLYRSTALCLRENRDTQEPVSQTFDAAQESKLMTALVVGTIGGGALAHSFLLFIGMIDSKAMPSSAIAWSAAVVLGLIVSRSGLDRVSLPNLNAAAAVVFCGLLASGGWQASGIAMPTMVVLAMIASRVSGEESKRQGSGQATWLVPIVAVAALMIFIVQTWRPSMQSWILTEQASRARSSNEQLRLMEAAAEADPLDVERQVQLVQLMAARTNTLQTTSEFTESAAALIEQLQRLSPPDVVGYMRPRLAGQLTLELAATAAKLGLPNAEFIAASGGFYRQAVERYPSSVELWVQSAAVSSLEDNWSAVASSLQKAFEISERTPHLDKKLNAQQIWLPLIPHGYESQTGYVAAEPLANWLRTQSEAKSAN